MHIFASSYPAGTPLSLEKMTGIVCSLLMRANTYDIEFQDYIQHR